MSKICVQRRDNRESCLTGTSIIGNWKSGRHGIVRKSMNDETGGEVQKSFQEFSVGRPTQQ